MLAVVYLILMVAFGDAIAHPLFSSVSRVHRLATAFLVGLLVSTWLTYLVALVFSGVEQPLIPADAVVAWLMALVAAIRVIAVWQRWRTTGETPLNSNRWSYGRRQSERWDWILIAAIGVFITWLMVSTFSVSDGRLNIAVPLWSDFGPTTAIAQSFAVGHNYPTQYPHFAGPAILYHFLFYFQVGNLTFLGLDPATANNVLSVGALTSMLALVVALGTRLFRSRATGWIAAILFFFHGALSFIPYLASFASPADALAGVAKLDHYLASGFPYRGEEWGIWTQNVFLNQRHLSSAIGIVLIALLFVVDRLQARAGANQSPVPAADPAADPIADPAVDPAADPTGDATPPAMPRATIAEAAVDRLTHPMRHVLVGIRDPALPSYLAAGLLLGLLPLWNSPMFIAGAALFGVIFVVFPNRVQMAALAVAAAIPAIPQVLFLRPSGLPGTAHFPTFHWGYIVDPPTLANVATYLGFIFGLKLLLVAVGLVATGSLQRRIFLAACSLVAVAFLVQFSVEVFANHKFLNAWLIIANVFAAYGLLRLWGLRLDRVGPIANFAIGQAARSVVVILAGAIVVGGVIDFVPIARVQSLSFPLAGDRLYDWVAQETKPTDVFLTDVYVTSPILLAGRAIYFGWPYYAWSAGYDTDTRQALYVRMLQSRDPAEVQQLLRANGIAYVAIDDGLRHNSLVANLNEDLYRASFKVVFQDTEGKYYNLVIYQVPGGGSGGPGGSSTPSPSALPATLPSAPASPANVFVAGDSDASGRLVSPRGIAVAPDGDILVADTGNHRIERFGPDGAYRRSFGSPGSGAGQFREPNGVAVDPSGHVFVADTANGRLQEFDDHDAFVREWAGAAPGFYGPRDVTVGADGTLYVLDQGHARVVRQPAGGEATAFGSFGAGPGQLNDPTGVAVAGELVFVADATNHRIQVFGTDGGFVRSIAVAEWSTPGGYPDVAVSADSRFLLASSPATNEVLVFTIDGRRSGSLKQTAPDVLVGPGALAIGPDGQVLVIDFDAARVSRLAPPGP